MTNEIKNYECDLSFFEGFYSTLHEDTIDSALEMEQEYCNKENIPFNYDDYDFQATHIDYAKKYVEHLNAALPDELEIKFQELISPREYNFANDRIIVTLTGDGLEYLDDNIIPDNFISLIKQRFTPYSGFIPYYSNDISEWCFSELRSWDHNELGTLLEVFVVNDDDASEAIDIISINENIEVNLIKSGE